LDGLLSQRDALALDQHVKGCGECWLEWQQLRAVSALFEDVELEQAPAGFAAHVMARVQRRGRWLALVRGAAFLVLGLAILLALGLVPLMALTGALSGSPAVLRALVSVVTSVAGLATTFTSALLLVLRSLLSGYGGLAFVGAVLLVGILAIPWFRLVTRPSRVRAGV
jgi:anti-sigma factor RsiW